MNFNKNNYYNAEVKSKSEFRNKLSWGQSFIDKDKNIYYFDEDNAFLGKSCYLIKNDSGKVSAIKEEWGNYKELLFRKDIEDFLPLKKGILCNCSESIFDMGEPVKDFIIDYRGIKIVEEDCENCINKTCFHCKDNQLDQCMYISENGKWYETAEIIDENYR